MVHTDSSTTAASLEGEPKVGEVVVLQIDHVESVAHLQDVKATNRMRAIEPKKYIGIIDKASTTISSGFLSDRQYSSP